MATGDQNRDTKKLSDASEKTSNGSHRALDRGASMISQRVRSPHALLELAKIEVLPASFAYRVVVIVSIRESMKSVRGLGLATD